MQRLLNITSLGILFIGTLAICLICYDTPWLWSISWIAFLALLWFSCNAAPIPVPEVVEYSLPTAEGTQIPTGLILTNNTLVAAVLHVCPDYIQAVTEKGIVRVEIHQFLKIIMQDCSTDDRTISGFTLVYQSGRVEENLQFAAPVDPWITKGIVKLLLEVYDDYYKGTGMQPLPYVELDNPNSGVMVHRSDQPANKVPRVVN